jgi:hypothetical protein
VASAQLKLLRDQEILLRQEIASKDNTISEQAAALATTSKRLELTAAAHEAAVASVRALEEERVLLLQKLELEQQLRLAAVLEAARWRTQCEVVQEMLDKEKAARMMEQDGSAATIAALQAELQATKDALARTQREKDEAAARHLAEAKVLKEQLAAATKAASEWEAKCIGLEEALRLCKEANQALTAERDDLRSQVRCMTANAV